MSTNRETDYTFIGYIIAIAILFSAYGFSLGMTYATEYIKDHACVENSFNNNTER